MQDSHVRRLIGQCRTVILVHGTISMKVVLIGNCKKNIYSEYSFDKEHDIPET